MEENNKILDTNGLYLVKLGRLMSDYKEEYQFFELEQPWAIVKSENLGPETFIEFLDGYYVDVFSGEKYQAIGCKGLNICDSYILDATAIYSQTGYVSIDDLKGLLEEAKVHVIEPGRRLHSVMM